MCYFRLAVMGVMDFSIHGRMGVGGGCSIVTGNPAEGLSEPPPAWRRNKAVLDFSFSITM
jgi:hypothetical protein